MKPRVTPPAPSVLLLIPAYNEERRIGPVLRVYAAFFRANYPGRFEIVVVLNGCRDNTLGVVRQAASEFSEISFIEFAAPIGKGGALIEGLKLAPEADLIGYVDADGATQPPAFFRPRAALPGGGLRRWLPLGSRRGAGAKPVLQTPTVQPRLSFAGGDAVLDADPRHPVRGQNDAAAGRSRPSIPTSASQMSLSISTFFIPSNAAASPCARFPPPGPTKSARPCG